MNNQQHNMDERIEFVATHYKPNVFDSRKGWEKIEQRIASERKVRKLPLFYSAAAAIALLLIISVLYLTYNTGETLVAKAGHTAFVLPDSSRINMQEGAELQYDKHFGKTERRVSMTGEISFAVARDEEKPFIVSTPTAEVRVLGTEFMVDADENETRLNVTSGKVQFTPESPAIPLLCTAGMTVHYTAQDENVKVTSPTATMEINGKNKSLAFNNAQLKDVALVLSHFYDVKINLPEEETTLTFTSSFTQKSVIEIINIINLTLDTHVKIEN
ncbi:MAG: FecR family protein [Bacteroidia bacterium]|nr:FecR family protein [Bacteroidia bacterium]